MDQQELLFALLGGAVTAGGFLLTRKRDRVESLSKDAVQLKEGLQLLASDNVAVQIGALYYLGLVAGRRPEFYEPIMDTLCTFVRKAACDRGEVSLDSTQASEALRFHLDDRESPDACTGPSVLEALPPIEVALRVIGTTPGASKSRFSRNLSRSDLRRYVFHGDLSHVNFRMSNLDYAYFDHANASLAKFWSTRLRYTVFSHAVLKEAKFLACDLTGARFENCDLEMARFVGTDRRNVAFVDCNMRDVDFESSDAASIVRSENKA